MRAPPSQPSTPSNYVQASPLVQSRVPHHIVDPHRSNANRPHAAATNDSSQSEPSIESCAASPSNTAADVPHGPSHKPLCDTLNPTAVVHSSTTTPVASSTAFAPPRVLWVSATLTFPYYLQPNTPEVIAIVLSIVPIVTLVYFFCLGIFGGDRGTQDG
ncbi:hypothetical protein MRB53_016877 [Persea americana]|uniref:Uncharacterized protein n=1 Tax=Persea americana TaxID=3435 RepID=A0ACC2M3Z0_PERAE|nr:hypothetical protein MRB53_016877 [Persea americana]